MWVTKRKCDQVERSRVWCRATQLAAASGFVPDASLSHLSRHFAGRRRSRPRMHQCYTLSVRQLARPTACVARTPTLPVHVNEVNHKPQRATCQLLQPREGAEPKAPLCKCQTINNRLASNAAPVRASTYKTQTPQFNQLAHWWPHRLEEKNSLEAFEHMAAKSDQTSQRRHKTDNNCINFIHTEIIVGKLYDVIYITVNYSYHFTIFLHGNI